MSIIINIWFGGKVRGTVMGFTFIGSGIGGLLLLPILNNIIQGSGWCMGYYTLSGIFVLGAIITFLAIVKSSEKKGFVRMGQKEGETAIKDAKGMMIKEAMKWR